MQLWHLSDDLLYGSQLAAAIERHGLVRRDFSRPDVMLAALNSGEPSTSDAFVVLIDLATSGLDVPQCVAALRAHQPPPRAVLAYGSHVAADRLAAARAAGCDAVLTRGELHARTAEILSAYASAPPQ